jgi:hypothetical protein
VETPKEPIADEGSESPERAETAESPESAKSTQATKAASASREELLLEGLSGAWDRLLASGCKPGADTRLAFYGAFPSVPGNFDAATDPRNRRTK